MADTRHANKNWNLGPQDDQGCVTYDQINCALLMDIRDELRRLNGLLHCRYFTQMPQTLARIEKRLAKKIPLR